MNLDPILPQIYVGSCPVNLADIDRLHWLEGRSLEEAVAHVTRCRNCDPYVDAIRLASEDRRKRATAEALEPPSA